MRKGWTDGRRNKVRKRQREGRGGRWGEAEGSEGSTVNMNGN